MKFSWVYFRAKTLKSKLSLERSSNLSCIGVLLNAIWTVRDMLSYRVEAKIEYRKDSNWSEWIFMVDVYEKQKCNRKIKIIGTYKNLQRINHIQISFNDK